LGGIVFAGLNARPASMRVDQAGVVTSLVEQGPLVVNVQGNGVLRTRDIRLITAQSEARVEKLLVQPGTHVEAGALLVQLVNPALNQLAEETGWSLEQAQAELNALRTQLDSEQLNQRSTIAKAEYAAESARLQVEAESALLKQGIVSKLTFQRSQLTLKQLDETLSLERERLVKGQSNIRAQLAAREAIVARLHKTQQRAQDQVNALSVRAPIDGTVQELALQPGQAVMLGASLIKLARPDDLYAELQVQEAMARDLAPGQHAQINIRTDTIPAEVIRVAPSVTNGTVRVEIRLIGALPRGARPDLTIDGTIETAHLDNVVQVGRPVFSQADSPANVYKVGPDGVGERIAVEFGTAAVSRIAVKRGLVPGDRIVVSDTSTWRDHDRVKIN
jgi:HlyD family secretion protein